MSLSYAKALSVSQVEAHYNDAEFPVNTVLPSITGTVKDGSTLTAQNGTWTGLAPITFTYQWERCNEKGEGCNSIASGTASTYTIGHEDVGSTLRVALAAKNSAGSGAATSGQTAKVEPLAPSNMGLPVISGEARDGKLLSVSEGSWSGTPPLKYAYQWESCNEKGESCKTIAGATAQSYRVVTSEIAKTLRTIVTAENAAGKASTTSAATAVIKEGPPVSTGAPAISGEAREGKTLTATSGTWVGTPTISYTYQWERCNGIGEGCSNISSATSASYVLASADVAHVVRVAVTATNAAGTAGASSSVSAVVAGPGAPSDAVLPTIAGAVKDGQALTASPGTWTGTEPITYAYQWQSCNSAGKECQAIEGASNQSYVLGEGDEGGTVRVLVTAKNVAGSTKATSAASGEVKAGPPTELEGPAISGIAAVGQALHVTGGQWGGSEVQISYQWERCNASGSECAAIGGATEGDYTLTEADSERTLRVLIGASNASGAVAALSGPTSLVAKASMLEDTVPPSVSGTAQNGKTLTASSGSWTGTAAISYAYQWQRCNGYGLSCKAVEGATSSSYALGSGDVGSTLRVAVTATSSTDGSASLTTSVTGAVAASGAPVSEARPTIAGTGLVGETLAATTGTWSGEGTISYAYQWQRCNAYGESCAAIGGATASTYTTVAADTGATDRVVVKATSGGGSTESPSAQMSVVATALADAAGPSISGSASTGSLLAGSAGIWTGAGTIAYAYQWERCNEKGESCASIAGATEPSYTLTGSDVGHTLKLLVTATSPSGKTSLPSPLTAVVSAESQAPVSVIEPSIEGNATEGQTLSAQHGTWLGSEPFTYAYQWERCNTYGEECTNIAGATSATYTLAKADVASTIRVAVTATNSNGNTSATSAQTEAIGAPGPPANTEAPALHGTAQQGQRLFASNGIWSGSRPLTFFYRWERCNALGEACAAIEGATKPSYTLQSADVGSTLRLKVSATNALGKASVYTAITAVVVSSAAPSVNEATELAQKTDPSVIAKSTNATLEEETVKPAAADTQEAISSESALTNSSVSKETPGEFAVSTPNGELSLAPLGTASNATTAPTIVNGTAAVFAGTSAQTDTIVRPEPLGATTLLQLHSAQAPTTFSWEVRIGAEQELQKLANGSVAVVEKESGSYLEGELPGEILEGKGKEASAETGEHGYSSEGAEEEFGSSIEGVGELEHLPAALTSSTTPVVPKEGELHPQETQPQYESGLGAMSYAESHATGKALMIIEQPSVMDAAGHTVPSSLNIEGNTVTMMLTPSKETTYPATAALAVASSSGKKAASPPEAHHGLSDEQASAFDESEKEAKPAKEFDARLKSHLKVESARLIIDFNASPHSQLLHEWLEAVKTAGISAKNILVTFRACVPEAPNYGAGKNERVPCPAEPTPTSASFPGFYYNRIYVLIKELIKDGVRTFGAWNEPDEHRNPLHRYPERAALLWGEAERAAEHLCGHHCPVLAGEFAGYKKGYIGSYLNTILRDAKRGLPSRTKATIWGLHDYKDLENVQAEKQGSKEIIAQKYVNTEANKYVHFIKAKRIGSTHIWLTEQGVQIETDTNKTGQTKLTANPELQRLAAQDFLRLGSPSMHTERIYYYGYRGVPKAKKEELASMHPEKHAFDSALLSGEGYGPEPANWRPAYCVLALGDSNGCPARTTTGAPVASTLTQTAATVVLDVNPEALLTTYKVEYGTTEMYGQSTSASAVANTEGTQSETVAVSGLQPCTAYHYQAEAENEANEGKLALGGDRTFLTNCVATSISVGGGTCASTTTGKVLCWGYSGLGTLGNGMTDPGPETCVREGFSNPCAKIPVAVNGISEASRVVSRGYTGCALLLSGAVKCWGTGQLGTLGNGTYTEVEPTPVSVSGLSTAAAITNQHTDMCTLITGGGVSCWGDMFELFTGDEFADTPTPISGVANAIAVGGRCAVISGGTVDCWGTNGHGMLGVGENEPELPGSKAALQVSGITNAIAVGQGGEETCALLSTGGIKCWGSNVSGALGDGSSTGPETCPYNTYKECSTIPVAVVGIANATAISVGEEDACALLSTGGVDCWGANGEGQLGNGKAEAGANPTPTPVPGITNAVEVSVGLHSTCVRLTGGKLDCWGSNGLGTLGDGTNTNKLSPVPVHGFGE